MIIKVVINKGRIQELFCLFYLFIFFEPPILSYYSQLSIVSKAFATMRYFLGILFLVKMLIKSINGDYSRSRTRLFPTTKSHIEFERRKNYNTSLCVFMYAVLLNIMLIIASYNNHTIYLTYVLSCISKIGFVAYNIVAYHKMRSKFFRCYAYLFTCYCVLNMLTQMVVPFGFMGYGDGRVWFLGLKNGTTLYLLLDLIMLAALYEYKHDKRVILFMLLINVCTIVNRSSTAIIVMFLLDIILYYQMFRNRSMIVNKATLLIVFVFLWFFFYAVVYNNAELDISVLVSKIVGKAPTFSGRTDVWQLAIEIYEKNKLWGAGIDVKFHPWGDPVNVVYSAHNSILEFLCKYGIFAAITFCVIMIAVFFQCLFLKNRKHSLLCCGIVLALFLAMMFEAEGNGYLFWSIVTMPYLLTDKKIRVI